jgi:hypothetical protein
MRTAMECQYSLRLGRTHTLHNLEIRNKSILQDGLAEHRPFRDDTGQEHNDDEVFVKLPSAHPLVRLTIWTKPGATSSLGARLIAVDRYE